jgi:phage repressor protein C with HTH and peptisase S24 domain
MAAGFENATAAADRFGWKPPTYLAHENGSRGMTVEMARDYAAAFRVTPAWLLFGDDALSDKQLVAETATGDLASIPIFDVSASAGHGAIVTSEEIVDRLSFPPAYLRHITSTHPRHLQIIGVKGDSMVPTLMPEDLVMLDRTKIDLSYDGVFVMRDGGDSLLVKRIGRSSRRGYVMVISDNPRYGQTERLASDIEVIGKVVWMGVKV